MRKETVKLGAISAISVLTLITAGLLTLQVVSAEDVSSSTAVEISADLEEEPFGLEEFVRLRNLQINKSLENSLVLEYLNLTPEEFAEIRNNGISLEDYAISNNYSVEGLEEAIRAEILANWLNLIESGKISYEQYASLVTNHLDEIIKIRMVLSEPPRNGLQVLLRLHEILENVSY